MLETASQKKIFASLTKNYVQYRKGLLIESKYLF